MTAICYALILITAFACQVFADVDYTHLLDNPCLLLDANDPGQDGWKGVNAVGNYPVDVDPQTWLIPGPLSEYSAVTIPADHYIELLFPSEIIDGPGPDILLIEIGPAAEQADIFLTDARGSMHFLATARASTAGSNLAPTFIYMDIGQTSTTFTPTALRIVGKDFQGGSPGFDLNSAYAATRRHYCTLADLDNDKIVNFRDFAVFAENWLRKDCFFSQSCAGADFNLDYAVDHNDLAVFSKSWLFHCYTCPAADLDHDGKVNLTDYAILARPWNSFTLDLPVDINEDGLTDFRDLRILAYHWLNVCPDW